MCTSSPSARSSRPNPSRFSARCDTGLRLDAGEPLAANGVDVVLGLEHDAERLLDGRRVERLAIERDQRRDPVQRLGDARNLYSSRPRRSCTIAVTCSASRAGACGTRSRRWPAPSRTTGIDPLIEAAALERVVHFARAVGREDDERRLGGANRAELGMVIWNSASSSRR